jgi:serine/threonine protein phosphatase PrpC
VLDERQLERLVSGTSDLAKLPGALVTTALERGSRDNCTVILAEYIPDMANG